VLSDQRDGDRGREPAVDVDDLGPGVAYDAPQAANRHGIGERRLMALAGVANQRGHCRAQLAHAVNDDAVALLAHGQPAVPGRCDGDLVAARRHVARQQLGLAVGAADERRIVVGGQQKSHAHIPGTGKSARLVCICARAPALERSQR